MYLGIVTVVTRRKTSKCSNGGCTLGEILAGELALTVVRKSRKGRSYHAFHFPCFLSWAVYHYQRRQIYLTKHPPERSGRPMGSAVKDLFRDKPELALERHECIRTRARLMRCIIGSSNPTRILDWAGRILVLDRRIKEILPLQVEKPGRRTDESRQKLAEPLREAMAQAARAGRRR